METILDNLFQLPCDSIMEGQPQTLDPQVDYKRCLASLDELAAIHDSMSSPFELKTCNLVLCISLQPFCYPMCPNFSLSLPHVLSPDS